MLLYYEPPSVDVLSSCNSMIKSLHPIQVNELQRSLVEAPLLVVIAQSDKTVTIRLFIEITNQSKLDLVFDIVNI